MKKNRIDIITMGCSKNLVDSEHLMRQLEECGYEVVHDSDEPCGEIAVINTCGFIGDAKLCLGFITNSGICCGEFPGIPLAGFLAGDHHGIIESLCHIV